MLTTKALAQNYSAARIFANYLDPLDPASRCYWPPYHPGEPAGSPATLIKSNIQEAARHLADQPIPKAVLASLLEPLERMLEDPSLLSGSQWGRAVFSLSSVFETFHLTMPVPRR